MGHMMNFILLWEHKVRQSTQKLARVSIYNPMDVSAMPD